MWRMSPKAKVDIARGHLTKARADAADGDLRDALQWSFASLEAGGAALHRSIHVVPELDELATGLRLCGHLTSLSPTKARGAGLPAPA